MYDAWAEANPSNGNVDKYDGRALNFMFSTTYISAYSDAPTEFVRKWSGACFKDYSSGMGGFCLLEDNDTDLETTTNTPLNVFTTTGSGYETVLNDDDDDNRVVLTYRLTADNFDSLETAWSDVALWDTSVGWNEQDGRCYYAYLEASASKITSGDEYLDYPSCAVTGNEWFCQMYTRARDQQEEGYPRFDTPGVVTGYFIASLIPNETASFNKVTQIVQNETSGAMTMSAIASVTVAAIASLAF